MSNEATLASKLKLLVAKAYKAEKLYGSMLEGARRQGSAAPTASSATGAISQSAHETRAREWQRAYRALREMLNDVLKHSGRKALAKDLSIIEERFRKRSNASKQSLEDARAELIDTAERGEFVHSLKLSFELIRLKADSQAHLIVADEVQAVLADDKKEVELGAEESFRKTEESELKGQEDLESLEHSRNVLPFKRRARF